MRLFRRYPWLFIALGLVLIANDYLKFAPEQILRPPMSYIVPIVFIVMGVAYYLTPYLSKKKVG